MNNLDNLFLIKWHYHTEGARCFIVTADGDVVCEIIAPGGGNPVPVARKIVSDHNDVLSRFCW